MSGIYDYLEWRGDLSFKNDKFNIIDNLILSMSIYTDFKIYVPQFPSHEYVSFKGIINKYFENNTLDDANSGLLLGLEPARLCLKMIETNRFKGINVSNYINEIDEQNKTQFSATSFIINNNQIYVAYKGTDDTLIGWEENFNMIVSYPIPAQIAALRYLNKMLDLYPNHKFIIGGHSKGGNLALYAAVYCCDQSRIEAVYSNDGPGFDKDKLDTKLFSNIKDRAFHIVPKDCIIGNILYHPDLNKIVVDSSSKGFYEHSGFTWKIKGNNFEVMPSTTKKSEKIRLEVNSIISNLTYEQRIDISTCLYKLISNSSLKTLSDLKNNILKALLSISKMNSSTRKTAFRLIKIFILNKAF